MRAAGMLLSASVVASAGCAVEGDIQMEGTSAAVMIEADGWRHDAQLELAGARAAHFNAVDGAIYAVRRGQGAADGLYRFDAEGAATKLTGADRPASVAVDPASGDIFVTEDFAGRIYRTPLGATGRQLWVAGFHAGDDDPVGAAIAGPDYAGDVVSPGHGLVVDRGWAGANEIWRFSAATPEGEVRVRGDDGTLLDPVDIAIGRDHVYVADRAAGAIYELAADGSLELVGTPVPAPVGIAVEAATGDLLVLDATADEVVRFALETGEVTAMFADLDVGPGEWTGIDVSPAGDRVVVADSGRGLIHVFSLDQPPVAACADRVVVVEDACEAAVSIDAGSYDPEGEPVDIAMSPEGPYPVGTTSVTLTVTDAGGQSDSCTATVTVETAGDLFTRIDDGGGSCWHRQGIWTAGGMFCRRPAQLDFTDTQLAVHDDGTAHLTGTAAVADSGCRDGAHADEVWSIDVWMDEISLPFGWSDDTRYFALRDGQARLSQVGGDAYVDLERRGGWPLLAAFGSHGASDRLGLTGAFFYTADIGGRSRTRPGLFHLDLAPMCAAAEGE